MKKIGMIIGVLALAVAANADVVWSGNVVLGEWVTEADEHVASDGTSSINSLKVGAGANGNGTLDVRGGTLNVANGGLFVASQNDSVGTININGGDMTVATANNFIGDSTTGGAEINLSSGSLTANGSFTSFWMGNGGANADLNISGGTLTGIRMLMYGSSDVSVTGNDATIDFENWTFNNGSTTTIDLTAKAAGISLLDINYWADNGGTQNLIVDISGYDTANGTSLDLIDNQYATFDASLFESIQIVGGTGDFAYTADGFGTILSLDNIVVPEPATIGLLGIGTLVTMLVRRLRM